MLKHEFKDGKLIVSANVDTNNDGQPVAKLELVIDLAEIPEEALAAILKKRSEKKA